MTKTFIQSFMDVDRLSHTELKPLAAMSGKLFEEGGELAECVNIHEGFITHKTMKEPLVGEVADVVQVALSILVKATPGMTPKARLNLFLEHFERKNSKWAAVQEGEHARNAEVADDSPSEVDSAMFSLAPSPLESAKPGSKPGDIEARVLQITSEQLGLQRSEIRPAQKLVEDLGADSLDLVELCMAVEDEFEMEISDRDAESIFTVQEMIVYVKRRYGIETYTDPAADYTERSGRYLSLEERMQERSVQRNKD